MASRLHAKFKVQMDMLDELLYADDMTKNAKTKENARGYGSSFTSLWHLWSHSQHEKDWGSVPARHTISFDIRNHGKNIRPSDVFDKVALDEVTFRRSDQSTKTFDDVS